MELYAELDDAAASSPTTPRSLAVAAAVAAAAEEGPEELQVTPPLRTASQPWERA